MHYSPDDSTPSQTPLPSRISLHSYDSAKYGRVTISGHLGIEMPIGTLLSVFKQAQIEREEAKGSDMLTDENLSAIDTNHMSMPVKFGINSKFYNLLIV